MTRIETLAWIDLCLQTIAHSAPMTAAEREAHKQRVAAEYARHAAGRYETPQMQLGVA